MSQQRLSSGTRIRWRGIIYQIIRLLPEGQVNLEDLLTGATSIVEMSTLVFALFETELEFVVEHSLALSEPLTNCPNPPTYLPLSDYPAALVAVARYRWEVIQPLLALKSRTRAAVSARVQEIKTTQSPNGERSLQNMVSVTATYRWLGDYARSGNDLRALIPDVHERGGKESSRLCSEVGDIVEIVVQEKSTVQEKITIDDVHRELAVRIAEENRLRPAPEQLPLPSRATLARRMAAADFHGHSRRAVKSAR